MMDDSEGGSIACINSAIVRATSVRQQRRAGA